MVIVATLFIVSWVYCLHSLSIYYNPYPVYHSSLVILFIVLDIVIVYIVSILLKVLVLGQIKLNSTLERIFWIIFIKCINGQYTVLILE